MVIDYNITGMGGIMSLEGLLLKENENLDVSSSKSEGLRTSERTKARGQLRDFVVA